MEGLVAAEEDRHIAETAPLPAYAEVLRSQGAGEGSTPRRCSVSRINLSRAVGQEVTTAAGASFPAAGLRADRSQARKKPLVP